jgi:two-component system chemotaxis response regulator CheY
MKVLIIEDDEIQRMLLSDLLRRFEKVEIVEAVDGAAAWQELENGLCPVLCCCDMNMPGMSGIEVLHQFRTRAALADVPFVFITAATDRETIEEAIASGATNYILKPLNLIKARSSLEKVFRGIRDRYSEEPAAAQKRMGVAPDRLLRYYDAFKQQVGDARPVMTTLLAGGDRAPVDAKLDNLKTGCTTLGLWHAALMVDCARALEAEPLDRVLAEVEEIVDEQTGRARIDFGMPKPRKPKVDETPEEENPQTAESA